MSTSAPNFTKEHENFGHPEVLTFQCEKDKEEEKVLGMGEGIAIDRVGNENEMLLSSSWFFPFTRGRKIHLHTIHISPHAFPFYIFDMRNVYKNLKQESSPLVFSLQIATA